MCLGVPGQVVGFSELSPDLATVDVTGVTRTVNVTLVRDDGVAVGDWVLIHVGFAMSVIDEDEAAFTLETLRSLGDTFDSEAADIARSRIE